MFSLIASAIPKLSARNRAWLIVAVALMASLTIGFTGIVIWDVVGRVVAVRADKGKIELDLNPRPNQVKVFAAEVNGPKRKP